MKICVFQPPYPDCPTAEDSEACVQWIFEKLGSMDPGSSDLILLPEFSNAPGLERNVEKNADIFCRKLADQARRLHSHIVAGIAIKDLNSIRNRAIVISPSGELAAYYDKIHLTAVESKNMGLTAGSKPVVVDICGVRVGFAVCFDIYFPEYIQMLASQDIDLLLCPSYQRSETSDRLRVMSACRAIDAGAYLVRSSYCLSTPGKGGHSLVAAPDGTIIADAGITPGVISVDIDPGKKFIKPASHGQADIEHRKLIQENRRPAIYSPNYNRILELKSRTYPRICAHRGLGLACPENTIPAFAAAISTGADEIELDLRLSRDGVPVVCHDPDLSRTTDIEGNVSDMTWSEICKADAGIRYGEVWSGVRMTRFEEVVELVDSRIGINIHIKDPGPDGMLVKQVRDLLRSKGLIETCYIAGDEDVLAAARVLAPDIERDCLAWQEQPDKMIDTAIAYGCTRLQFGRNVEKKHTARAHDNGIICNLFWSNEPEDARQYISNGIDVILTDCAHQVSRSAVLRPE